MEADLLRRKADALEAELWKTLRDLDYANDRANHYQRALEVQAQQLAGLQARYDHLCTLIVEAKALLPPPTYLLRGPHG